MTKKAERLESPWQTDVQLALGDRSDLVIWRETIGSFRPMNAAERPDAIIKVGTPGWPDIMGWQVRRYQRQITKGETSFTPVKMMENVFYGQIFGIETKSTTGTLRAAQEQAQKIFRAHYGIFIEARDGDWASIWRELGEEPDEVCADEADRMRRELGIGGPTPAKR